MPTIWLGGEFHAFTDYLTINGIIHRISCPHTHQQNGVVERKHRHIVENALTLLARASMPFKYWDESFRIVVFLHNRPPSPVSQVSLLYSFFLIMFLITRLLEYLVVLAILTLDHITSINLSFGLYNVHF